jgi:hypothetical protein
MPTILRPSRAVFRFSGPEAQKLLFDVVTGRLLAEPGPAVWWALLSPQGKVQAEGLSGWAQDNNEGAFWLDVDQSVADAFLKKMRLYRLRAKVEIDDLRATHSVGWTFDGWTGAGIAHADPRGLGERVIALNEQTGDWQPEDETFERHRIAAGIPEQGPRLRDRRELRARYRARPARRHRLREGLLYRAGSREPHEASRHGATAPGDRFGRRCAGRHAGGGEWTRRRAYRAGGGRQGCGDHSARPGDRCRGGDGGRQAGDAGTARLGDVPVWRIKLGRLASPRGTG